MKVRREILISAILMGLGLAAGACIPDVVNSDSDSAEARVADMPRETAATAITAPVAITLIHTNDIHSHLRSDQTTLRMGGLARIRTAIQAIRAQDPGSLLVDAGDWSEGDVYYSEGGGAESLKLMDWMGYDVAVVGNHDWLNGPDAMIGAIRGAHLGHLQIVGANFDTQGYRHAEDLSRFISSYSIQTVQGVKIAFVGLVCSDPLYGIYLKPVRAMDAGKIAQKFAAELKSRHLADIVVGLSHNRIGTNRDILQAAPDMDLIIGAHDHQRLIHPVVVQRPGHPDAWIVEAGMYGHYLGRVELVASPGAPGAPLSLALHDYHLTQIDRFVAEDGDTLARIEALEKRIEAKKGGIFHDHVADLEDSLEVGGLETPIGDLVTDAYRGATHVDVAIEQNELIYDDLPRGPLTSADVFRAMPPIYNLKTGSAWTLETFEMKGSTLNTFIRALYSWRKTIDTGGFSFSGLEVMIDPGQIQNSLSAGQIFDTVFKRGESPVRDLKVEGAPVDPDRDYTFAASSGLIAAFYSYADKYVDLIKLTHQHDTGLEDWRVTRDYLGALSHVSMNNISYGNRVRTVGADLGIVPGSFKWVPTHELPDGSLGARVELRIRNFGGQVSPASGVSVDLSTNRNGVDATVDIATVGVGAPVQVPALEPGESRVFVWDDVEMKGDRGLYPLTAYIHTIDEYNKANDGATINFAP